MFLVLGVVFVGINLYKWIGVLVGLGVLYIWCDCIVDVVFYLGEYDDGCIDVWVYIGMFNFVVCLVLFMVLVLYVWIGVVNKWVWLLWLCN